jgi:hypothetical protein
MMLLYLLLSSVTETLVRLTFIASRDRDQPPSLAKFGNVSFGPTVSRGTP